MRLFLFLSIVLTLSPFPVASVKAQGSGGETLQNTVNRCRLPCRIFLNESRTGFRHEPNQSTAEWFTFRIDGVAYDIPSVGARKIGDKCYTTDGETLQNIPCS